MKRLLRPRIVGLLAVAIIAISVTAGTGFAPLDDAVRDGSDAAVGFAGDVLAGGAPETETDSTGEGRQSPDAGGAATDGARTVTESSDDGAGIDRAGLERAIHREINAVRADRDRSELAFDTELRRVARYHSRDMARAGYFGHESPDGETMSDRYERFEYDCRVPVGGNRYLAGAENVFKYRSSVDVHETDVAAEVVDGWMDSPGHRRNVLTPEFRREAIGVAVAGDGSVYVTQNFC